MKTIKSVSMVSYHRNGVNGEGFYAVLFVDFEDRQMVASVFEGKGRVAIFEVGGLSDPRTGVRFGVNSWRGDTYEAELRSTIKG